MGGTYRLRVRQVSAMMLLAANVLFGIAPTGLTAGSSGGPGIRKIVVPVTSLVGNEQAHADMVRQVGGTILKRLPLVNGLAVWLPEEAAASRLATTPGILRVDEDLSIQAVGQVAAIGQPTATAQAGVQPAQTTPWGVARIKANQVWPSGVTGAGIKVAVLDTGIDLSHPDLKANIKGGYNALNPRLNANDDNGHGTHVAGIIGGADNTIGVVGVAPRASLYAVKVLDRNGSGYLSDLIEGLDWAIRNGMQVVNLSLGTSTDNQTFHDAITRAYDAGITMVAAAGNAGPNYGSVLYPAKYPEVIAVSASNQADQQPSWSSWGPEVDLAAPGASIYSTYAGGTYQTLSGTSMAAPHATGSVTLVLAKWGPMTPVAVRTHLATTGEPVATLAYPLVDALAAVNSVPLR